LDEVNVENLLVVTLMSSLIDLVAEHGVPSSVSTECSCWAIHCEMQWQSHSRVCSVCEYIWAFDIRPLCTYTTFFFWQSVTSMPMV